MMCAMKHQVGPGGNKCGAPGIQPLRFHTQSPQNLYGFPGGSSGKESACSAGEVGSIPGSARSLEEGMANHSSILAWRITWTEEPGRPQSMGSQRVGHD